MALDLEWLANKMMAATESIAKLAGAGETQNLRLDNCEDDIGRLEAKLDASIQAMRNESAAKVKDAVGERRSWTKLWVEASIALLGAAIGAIITALIGIHNAVSSSTHHIP
jgi:uncharacterized membrane protein YcjF (UPF0283 family)